jgi:hypothetical protein
MVGYDKSDECLKIWDSKSKFIVFQKKIPLQASGMETVKELHYNSEKQLVFFYLQKQAGDYLEVCLSGEGIGRLMVWDLAENSITSPILQIDGLFAGDPPLVIQEDYYPQKSKPKIHYDHGSDVLFFRWYGTMIAWHFESGDLIVKQPFEQAYLKTDEFIFEPVSSRIFALSKGVLHVYGHTRNSGINPLLQ